MSFSRETSLTGQRGVRSFMISLQPWNIYRAFLPYCDTAHITWIDYEYMADTWFPDLDKDPDWEVTADSDEQTYFDLCYEFRRYERTGKKALALGEKTDSLL